MKCFYKVNLDSLFNFWTAKPLILIKDGDYSRLDPTDDVWRVVNKVVSMQKVVTGDIVKGNLKKSQLSKDSVIPIYNLFVYEVVGQEHQ